MRSSRFGVIAAVVLAVAMAVIAVIAGERLGDAFRVFLAAGTTICVGVALRFLATILDKRMAEAAAHHEGHEQS